MTEEEKKNKTKDEDKDQDTEEENDDLKFDMPEPNRVTMPAEDVKEQPDYLKVFANFYISEFNQHDLEIINLYDTNSNMVDINHYLMNNIHFSRKQLINHVLQYHDYNFQNILDEIAKKEDIDPKNMKTYKDWDTWYEKRRAQIPRSLS